MIEKNGFKILILTIITFTLISCQNNSIENTKVNEAIGSDAYPVDVIDTKAPNAEVNLAYPFPSSDYDLSKFFPETVDIPEPGDDTGVVIGRILTISGGNVPYLNAGLYLGSYIASNEGGEDKPLLVGISLDEDPHAAQGLDGSFAFSEVPPGTYGLFLCTPMSVTLMADAKTGQYVNVDVVAGEVIDLGTLYVP